MLYLLFWFYLFACLVFVRMVNDHKSISGKKPQHTIVIVFFFLFVDWTSEENSMDETSIKSNNKLKLKKLILLSLRGIGIKKSDKQFMNTWKHLYCGCIFSLVFLCMSCDCYSHCYCRERNWIQLSWIRMICSKLSRRILNFWTCK